METSENKNTIVQDLQDTAKAVFQREVQSNTGLYQETRKKSNNLTLHLKELQKGEQTKHKVSRRKEMMRSNQK